MDAVSREGRTVLFVSHNMAAVASLCKRAFLLQEGHLVKSGRANDVIAEYLHNAQDDDRSAAYHVDERLLKKHQADNRQQVIIKRVELLDPDGKPLREIGTGDGFVIRVHYHAMRRFVAPAFMISIRDRYGVELTRLSTMPISGYFIESIEGDGVIELLIVELPLSGGLYLLTIGIARANVEWILQLENIASLNVKACDVYQSGLAIDNSRGLITLNHRWSLLSMSDCAKELS